MVLFSVWNICGSIHGPFILALESLTCSTDWSLYRGIKQNLALMFRVAVWLTLVIYDASPNILRFPNNPDFVGK